jgi:CRISPR-associated protein Cmr4
MISKLVYLYLLSPLHTGGTTQEGNLLGIARESHTNFPYIPSSTIRGRLRASVNTDWDRLRLFGVDLDDLKKENSNPEQQQRRELLHQRYKAENNKDLTQLEQGSIWIGDGSILWVPVPSLSHGIVWISCPLLLQRWARLNHIETSVPNVSEKLAVHPDLAKGKPIYLKDAILKPENLQSWDSWKVFVPQSVHTNGINRAIVLPDQHCATLIQMSLWRQVKIKLDQHKTVDGGFRYEEAIPPDTLMYFPWGVTAQANGKDPGFGYQLKPKKLD